jgi:glycosyltransferase involved in cell wall biosynthesis
MRVLFVTQVIDRTHENLGAIHGWIAALANEVEHVHAIALSVGDVELPSNVSLYSLGKDRGYSKPHQMQIFQSEVARLVVHREVDLFFPHMVPLYAMLVEPYRLAFRIPSVMWYAHNTADLKLKLANACVDRFVTVSKDSFPLGLARCDVVGHGIETDLFTPAAPRQDGKTRFLTLGRVCARKDQATLVAAADIVVNRLGRRDVEFVIAGGPLVAEDHVYLERLRARVRELGLEKFVSFPGSVPHSEAVHQVQACDFFVNMHAEGGLGKAVLEAMSCGKPAFVSTPTYYDSFPAYGERFLFRARDHEELAGKMASAVEMRPTEVETVSRDLREWVVEEHDVGRQMSRIAGVLRAVKGRS